MTDTVAIALIAAGGTVITTSLGILNTIFAAKANRRGETNEQHLLEAKGSLTETKSAVTQLAHETNSMKDTLVNAIGEKKFKGCRLERN